MLSSSHSYPGHDTAEDSVPGEQETSPVSADISTGLPGTISCHSDHTAPTNLMCLSPQSKIEMEMNVRSATLNQEQMSPNSIIFEKLKLALLRSKDLVESHELENVINSSNGDFFSTTIFKAVQVNIGCK